jgi:septum formation protein
MFVCCEDIILASGSPRRKELLEALQIHFKVVVSDVPEYEVPTESPSEMVTRLSYEKANAVAEKFPQSWVIGADTTVFCNNKIYGKPRTIEHAVTMLSELQGRKHSVYTGLTLLHRDRKYVYTYFDETKVTFRSLSEQEILSYSTSYPILDKAGAYAVQDIFGLAFIYSIEGSYTTILGLNTTILLEKLLSLNIVKLQS